jgi:hypothetical protein
MFSFFSSLFNSEGGVRSSRNKTIKDTIIETMSKLNILYDEKQDGLNIKMDTEFIVVVPSDFNKEQFINIKKELKDKDGNIVTCHYIYKYANKELKFVNRIKVVDSNYLKCDSDESRIDIKLIKKTENLLNSIIENHKKNIIGGTYDISSARSESINESTSNSITKSDINDYKYLQKISKYKELKKKISNINISESS